MSKELEIEYVEFNLWTYIKAIGIIILVIFAFGILAFFMIADHEEGLRQQQYISYFEENPPILRFEITYSNLKIDKEVNNTPYIARYDVSFRKLRNRTFDPFSQNSEKFLDEILLLYTVRFPGYGIYEATQVRIKCNLTFQNNYSFQYIYKTTNLKNIPKPDIVSFSLEAKISFWINATQVKEILDFR